MLKSKLENVNNDFLHIFEEKHISQVYKEMEFNFDKYFNTFGSNFTNYADQLKDSFKVKDSVKTLEKHQSNTIQGIFKEAIEQFERESEKYNDFFEYESLQEYLYDPNTFKDSLKRECPIIRRCVNSKRLEMAQWQHLFRQTASHDLLTIFSNLVHFFDNYTEDTDPEEYAEFDLLYEFDFDEIQDENTYTIIGVIGMGIKSTILYHLNPQLFPIRVRRDVYGLYFLSGQKDFRLPSKSSEFLMIDDSSKKRQTNIKMEYNYDYPYTLFILYALRLYRLLKQRCNALGIYMDDNYRYVYVSAYLNHVCDQNSEVIKTMLCSDEYIYR